MGGDREMEMGVQQPRMSEAETSRGGGKGGMHPAIGAPGPSALGDGKEIKEI
jgi:hypothetical protein